MPINNIVIFWGFYQNQLINSIKIINSSGAYVEILTYGATIVNLVIPDKRAELGNVVLGYSDLEAYLNDQFYLGSTIGRSANRIREGRINIGDHYYELDKNDGKHTNHGGYHGYHSRIFEFELIANGVIMTLQDQDGTGGYPGTLLFKVTYKWTEGNELIIEYEATCDRPTVANFTNHTYFDLSGKRDSVLDNRLRVDAMLYLENDEFHIPTGILLKDPDGFAEGKVIDDIVDKALPVSTGLNRYFILTRKNTLSSSKAELTDAVSGRRLQVFTSYPGIMIYTGQYLNTGTGREGKSYKPLDGICLECQHYPDSIN
ncbi:MAG: galactose mutarotase, partial [Sphingobacteriales bacterium]